MNTKRSMRLLAAAACLIGFSVLESQAATTYYVATNGTGNGDSWAAATNNIQGAIDRTSPGDTVLVSNGVYEVGGVVNYPAGTTMTNRVAIWKAITVRSANNDPTNTIIRGSGPNGDGAVRGVYMADGSALIGFTVASGATTLVWAKGTYGGGVCCQSAAATISNCFIINNSAFDYAGGVWQGTLYNCKIANNTVFYYGGGSGQSTLYDCIITNNSASVQQGGGVWSCSVVSNCTISGNTSGGHGGGVGSSILYNCMVTNNTATWWGGGAFGSTLYNSLLSGNSGNDGGGAHGGTLYNCTIAGNRTTGIGGGVNGGTLWNCISWGNDSADSSGSGGTLAYYYSCGVGYTGEFNKSSDPYFVNSAEGNYHLLGISPCINAGTNGSWTTNATDLDGHRRIWPVGGIVDMGAYEQGSIITVSIRCAKDTFMDSYYHAGGTNLNANTWTTLFCGNASGSPGGEKMRPMLGFDLGSIPRGSCIHSATLRSWFSGAFATNVTTISMHRLTTAWTEAGACWDTSDGTNAWSAGAGGDYVAAPSSSLTSSFANGQYTFTNLAADVQSWVSSRSVNAGWIIVNSDEVTPYTAGNTPLKVWYSYRDSSAHTETLYVEYEVVPPSGTIVKVR